MRSFEVFRQKFARFYEAVKAGHENSTRQHQGHGLDHDITVAQIAVMISPDARTGTKAWVASMLHSTDRIVPKGDKGAEEYHVRKRLAFLPEGYFTPQELEEIVQAVLRHAELNRDDQSLVQQVLMDADRLSNLMPSVIIRAGQFQSDIPAFEFEYLDGKRNPASTYHEPKSVLDDLRNNIIEYPPKLRLPKAKKLAIDYVNLLHGFIKAVENTNKNLGLAKEME
ncbi:MAG: HD domain-containing protein [bacterium]|nr:HD domain-containing protein [bacterium]